MTDTREMIELAAKACTFDMHKDYSECFGLLVSPKGKNSYGWWNPAMDQTDSDRLACQLGIDISWHSGYVIARAFLPALEKSDHVEKLVAHDNTIEGKSAAVRQARLMVAAEIGKNL